MKRFCTECGKEAGSDDKACIHCGTPLPESNIATKTRSNKEAIIEKRAPMSKKKKVLFSVLGAVAVLVIAFIMWTQSYQSPEAVEKRFAKAISEENTAAVQKLLVHEDGSSVKKGEAQALLSLVEEEGAYIAEELFSVASNGKFFFLFTAYKVIAVDQFAVFSDPVEGLSISFNDNEIAQQDTGEGEVIYGPLIPGAYKVEAMFAGEYGNTKKDDMITLYDSYGDETWLDMEVNVSEVVFYVEDYEEIDRDKSFVKLGDKEISIGEDGYTESVGPLILDGSQQVQTVVTTPWGEVESEPFDIDDSEMTVHPSFLSDKHFSEVAEKLKNFGEQYAESMADKNTKHLKSVSDHVKTAVEDMMWDDVYFSGSLEKVEMDRYSITAHGIAEHPSIEMYVQYTFNQADHELDETPDLNENTMMLFTRLAYDQENKSWNILEITEDFGATFSVTDTVEGSKKVYSPGKEAIAQAKSVKLNADISNFMEDYTAASVDAINYNDFYYVEYYIAPDSPRWDEAKDYIDYLDSKGITEDLLDMEVESIEETDDETWEVTVKESFTIHKSDSSSDKTYRTKVIVKEIEEEYVVYELIETNEI